MAVRQNIEAFFEKNGLNYQEYENVIKIIGQGAFVSAFESYMNDTEYEKMEARLEQIEIYLKIASDLYNEVYNGELDYQYYEELLRKMSYNVGQGSKLWSGEDAVTYAATAREICTKIREAEILYERSLLNIMSECRQEKEEIKAQMKVVKEQKKKMIKQYIEANRGVLGTWN